MARRMVLLTIGVNGAGKTTTIGKLSAYYKGQGKSVMLAAADTFRAAAIDQLEVWGERTGARVIKHEEGSDPAAVAYDAVQAAKARGIDVLIIDTAGRLQTKSNLMQELEKINRVIGREIPGALSPRPHRFPAWCSPSWMVLPRAAWSSASRPSFPCL